MMRAREQGAATLAGVACLLIASLTMVQSTTLTDLTGGDSPRHAHEREIGPTVGRMASSRHLLTWMPWYQRGVAKGHESTKSYHYKGSWTATSGWRSNAEPQKHLHSSTRVAWYLQDSNYLPPPPAVAESTPSASHHTWLATDLPSHLTHPSDPPFDSSPLTVIETSSPPMYLIHTAPRGFVPPVYSMTSPPAFPHMAPKPPTYAHLDPSPTPSPAPPPPMRSPFYPQSSPPYYSPAQGVDTDAELSDSEDFEEATITKDDVSVSGSSGAYAIGVAAAAAAVLAAISAGVLVRFRQAKVLESSTLPTVMRFGSMSIASASSVSIFKGSSTASNTSALSAGYPAYPGADSPNANAGYPEYNADAQPLTP